MFLHGGKAEKDSGPRTVITKHTFVIMYVSVYSMYAGTDTFMIFIYIQADFCQYVKSLFLRSILESEM